MNKEQWVLIVTLAMLALCLCASPVSAEGTLSERLQERVEYLAKEGVAETFFVRPVILNPSIQYGQRVRQRTDVRSRTRDQKNPETERWEYRWWTENIVVPRGGEIFEWSWERELAPDEYFQVQLICPNGCHRGIHPPTKDYFTVQGGCLRYIVQDCKGAQTRAWDYESWDGPRRNIPIQWTVAVVKWNGIDPGKIGPTLIEAIALWIKI